MVFETVEHQFGDPKKYETLRKECEREVGFARILDSTTTIRAIVSNRAQVEWTEEVVEMGYRATTSGSSNLQEFLKHPVTVATCY